jgi:hypothetical protein
MNNLTEIKITNITPRSKIGMIGNLIYGRKITEDLINQFNFNFNVIFSPSFEIESKNIKDKIVIYNKSEEYNFVFNHLIKYIDYANNMNGYLIIFDEFCNNNYYLQKLYFSNILTIITNNYLQLHLTTMHDYIIVFYINDIEIQTYIYNTYFTNLFPNFDEFKIIYDKLNVELKNAPYISLVLHHTNDTLNVYFLKNTFYYEIEI